MRAVATCAKCSCLAEVAAHPSRPVDSFAVWGSSGLSDLTLALLFLGSEQTHFQCLPFRIQFL